MNQPIITVLGNVATQPRKKEPKPGLFLTQFRLAQTQRKRNHAGYWEDGSTSWFNVVCWRDWGENVANSLSKGDPVIITGRLKVTDWKRDGRSGTDVVIDAFTIGHDLRRGESQFTRVRHERPDPVDEEDQVFELNRMADAEVLAERLTSNAGSSVDLAGGSNSDEGEPAAGEYSSTVSVGDTAAGSQAA